MWNATRLPAKLLEREPADLVCRLFPWTIVLLSPNVLMTVAFVVMVLAIMAPSFYSGGLRTTALPLHRLPKQLLLQHRLPVLPSR